MEYSEILKEAMRLSSEERLKLSCELRMAVNYQYVEPKKMLKERFEQCRAAMASVMGMDVIVACRAGLLPTARYVMCDKLYSEGYTMSDMARLMGCNHSTLSSGLTKLYRATGRWAEEIEGLTARFEEELMRMGVEGAEVAVGVGDAKGAVGAQGADAEGDAGADKVE